MTTEALHKQIPFYLAAGIIFLLLKLGHSMADHNALQFLLWPTSKLVALMTGASSSYLPEGGYFHAQLNIVINKSCSGFNFWLICFLMLYSMGLFGAKKIVHKALWLPGSLFLAYLLTIFVNSSRILIALALNSSGIGKEQAWLHQAEGVFSYLFFLLIIYFSFDFLLKKHTQAHEKPT